jgi:hypothetical protein
MAAHPPSGNLTNKMILGRPTSSAYPLPSGIWLTRCDTPLSILHLRGDCIKIAGARDLGLYGC